MPNISVILADAEYLIRIGLKHILANQKNMEVIAEASDEEDLMELMETEKVDVIIMDYNQPDHFSISSIEKLTTKHPYTGILIVSADNEKDSIYQVLEYGITCFLTKSCNENEILEGIKAANTNQRYFCSKVMDYVFEKSFSKSKEEKKSLPLTAREIEIVQLVAQGLIAKEIAHQLQLSTHTVYTHRKNIMRKLKINTGSELILYAIHKGLVK